LITLPHRIAKVADDSSGAELRNLGVSTFATPPFFYFSFFISKCLAMTASKHRERERSWKGIPFFADTHT